MYQYPTCAAPSSPGEAIGFDTPEPHELPFRTVLVASQDDPNGSFAHAEGAAATFGAELVDVGALGHINSHSGIGCWPQGRALLDALLTPSP